MILFLLQALFHKYYMHFPIKKKKSVVYFLVHAYLLEKSFLKCRTQYLIYKWLSAHRTLVICFKQKIGVRLEYESLLTFLQACSFL